MPTAAADSGTHKVVNHKEPTKTINTAEVAPEKTKKKKRLRIRVRPRNKHVREAAAAAAAAASAKTTTTNADKIETFVSYLSNNNEEKLEATAGVENIPVAQPRKMQPVNADPAAKTREEVMAEREAKKLAKQQQKKDKVPVEKAEKAPEVAKANPTVPVPVTTTPTPAQVAAPPAAAHKPQVVAHNEAVDGAKTREQIKAEREAKKQAKQATKAAKTGSAADGPAMVTEKLAELKLGSGEASQANNAVTVKPVKATAAPAPAVTEDKKKPVLSKAERRAIQEAQRAAKAQSQKTPTAAAGKSLAAKVSTAATPTTISKAATTTGREAPTTTTPRPNKGNSSTATGGKSTSATANTNACQVKLFNHLKNARKDVSLFVNDPQIHPSIVRLGEQYAKRTVVGSNARCVAFLNALKQVVQDFETPPKKAFSRSLETTINACVEHLQKCRPLAVSIVNAHKHIKHVLTQLPGEQTEAELKESVCLFIDTYIENQIGKAALAISCSMQEKINKGDVILTFGCSSLISFICEQAQKRNVDFRVIIVDSRPFCEGQELLRRLTAAAIPCTYVLINAISFVMPQVTKVLLGAHALLANGYVMGRVGTAQVALVAQAFNVPVLVCCETHKFSERFQTDAIVSNELGNPEDLVMSDMCCLSNWQAKGKMTPLNLIYDVTPPELVTAVVTEVSILPCTSVPVILRIKPTEIGY